MSTTALGTELEKCFAEAAHRYGIAAELLHAIAAQESRLDPSAIGHNADGSRDIGVMQINTWWLPRLAKYGIGEDHLREPCTNVMWVPGYSRATSHGTATRGMPWAPTTRAPDQRKRPEGDGRTMRAWSLLSLIWIAALAGCATQPASIGEFMEISPLGIEQATGGRYVVCDACPTRTAKTPWQSSEGSASETTRGGAASSAGQSIAAGMAIGPGGPSMSSNANDNTDSNTATTASDKPLLTLTFPFDVSHVQPEHRQLLAGFASEVLPTPQRKSLLVVGYTDDIGPDRYNQLLARKRADSVAKALRDLGIDAVRIEAKGKCCYVADNETPQGRAQNRRAEIHILSNLNIKESFQ